MPSPGLPSQSLREACVWALTSPPKGSKAAASAELGRRGLGRRALAPGSTASVQPNQPGSLSLGGPGLPPPPRPGQRAVELQRPAPSLSPPPRPSSPSSPGSLFLLLFFYRKVTKQEAEAMCVTLSTASPHTSTWPGPHPLPQAAPDLCRGHPYAPASLKLPLLRCVGLSTPFCVYLYLP